MKSTKKIVDLAAHFWSQVDTSEDKNACWEWTGLRNKARGGYGTCYVKRQSRRAHRVAFEFSVGKIPTGLLVLHSCDNPPCCNPNHLRLGTHKDNSLEMFSKGRNNNFPFHAFGERCGLSKLTDETVKDILNESGKTPLEISQKYGVSRSSIYCIIHRKTWKHLNTGETKAKVRKQRRPHRRVVAA